ncbi:PTS transporter subunit IIC, partial [Maribacter flavus]
VAISFTMGIIFLFTSAFAGPVFVASVAKGKHWFMFSLMLSITFAAGVYVILQGVRMVIAEIVPAFKGNPTSWCPTPSRRWTAPSSS